MLAQVMDGRFGQPRQTKQHLEQSGIDVRPGKRLILEPAQQQAASVGVRGAF